MFENPVEFFTDAAVKAYIQVMGQPKWDSITLEEKNNAIHIIVMDFCKAANAALDA